MCPFLLTFAFGLVSLILSFVYLLPLQAHALITAHCPVWLAWTVSVIFVLIESALMDLIFFAILMPIFQDALFDATLRAKGLDRIFDTRIHVSGLVLCCRGISSGLAMVWLLVLAQVSEQKRKKKYETHFGYKKKKDFNFDHYSSVAFNTCGWYMHCLLHQWMGSMVKINEVYNIYISIGF